VVKINLKLDYDDITKFYQTFLTKEHIYQVFYKTGYASKQQKIDSLKHLKSLVNENKLTGLQCCSLNPRDKQIKGIDSVSALKNILFDIDIKSKYKENGLASLRDKRKAKKVMADLVEHLEEKGFEVGGIIDSGNGYHVYLPVDIPLYFKNKEEWKKTPVYKKLVTLEKEAKKFEIDRVEIDNISKDITRRVKLPGTWNVKPDMDEERYRRAKIIEIKEFSRDNNNEVFKELEAYEQDKPSKKSKPDYDPEKLDERLEKALEFDDKFRELYEGDTSEYPSRSEGELALACKCVYYGFDPYTVLDSSGMTKWDEKQKSYKKLTVNKAEQYISSRFNWEEFNSKNTKNIDAPDFEAVKENYSNLLFDRDKYGGKKGVNKQDAIYYLEDSDIPKLTAFKKISEYLLKKFDMVTMIDNKAIWYFSNPVYSSNGKEFIEQHLHDHFGEYISTYWVREVIADIKRATYTKRDKLEKGKNFLALKDSWLDLETFELTAPNPDYFVFNELNIDYNPEADCPKFKEFLEDRMPLKEDRILLQEFLGTALLRDKVHKKACIIVGYTDSGKSTLLRVIEEIFGNENCCHENPKRLTGSRWSKVSLQGKLLNIAHELEGGKMSNLSVLKKIFDGNHIVAERKGQNTFSFEPTCEHIFAGNKSFHAETSDTAFWNRWLVLEMPESLPEEDKIRGFHEVLLEEKEGIFNWMLEGLKRFRENNNYFTVNRSFEKERDRWRCWGDSAQRFIHSCIYNDPKGRISSEELYDIYLDWVENRTNLDPYSHKQFTSFVKQISYVRYSRNLRFDGKKMRGFTNIGVDADGMRNLAEALKQGRTYSLERVFDKKQQVRNFIALKNDGEGVHIDTLFEFFEEDDILESVIDEMLENGDLMESPPHHYQNVY